MAAGSFVGRIGELNLERETFTAYIERMEMFFIANGIVEKAGEGNVESNKDVKDRKRAIFLTEIGPEAFTTLVNILAPRKPRDTDLSEIIQCLKNHYDPPPLEITQSYHFGTRNQMDNESVSEYIVALKKLSIHCNYGEFLNRALRDRFVCGLKNDRVQNKLLNTPDLTFDKACQIATAMELAEKNTREFKPETGAVHKVAEKVWGAQNPSHAETSCFRCKGKHNPRNCKFKDATCFKCKKTGHIASVCRSKQDKGKIKLLQEREESSDDEMGYINAITNNRNKDPYIVEMCINGKPVSLQIDTAADYSIMPLSVYKSQFGKEFPLLPATVKLKTYTGESVNVSGKMVCDVEHNGQKYKLDIIVSDCQANSTLLGRNWLAEMKIEWSKVFNVVKESQESRLNEILDAHSSLFREEYKGIKGHVAHIRIQDGAKPKYHKPRSVPYAMKTMVEEELDRLERQGIISKINETEWASPIVVVPKSDGTVRLCGDYKVSINPVVDDEQYPLPTAQDLFAALAGSKIFSKLDLSHAYSQVSSDAESQKYLSINTHRGLYAYNKLPYGVKSASKIFQAVMDKILQGIPNVLCFQDDVLVGGADEEEHLRLLKQVLDRLTEHEVQLKLEKCRFMQAEVTFLGHKINAEGVLPLQEKVDAIAQAPQPRDVSELRSFLGMMQYYARFMPNLATTLAPLYELLKKDVTWKWSNIEQSAFDKCKKSLTCDTLLVHYDVKRELRLACDASNYGVGAVISHVMDDGQERPIAYASRTLTKSEKNYSQIEKEALAIIFGVKKFHQYIFGRRFTLVTDHQPLVTIFGPTSPIPTLAAARMQRWALILAAHDYNIEYRRSSAHANADALSRLPMKVEEKQASANVYKVSAVNDLPVSARDIALATRRDPTLSRVYEYTMSGWPVFADVPEEMKPYHNRRHELSCEQDCLLWGMRVVVPDKLREKVLAELHFEHPGMCSMKAIARSFVWWPKLDACIEQVVKQCSICQKAKGEAPKVPLMQWTWPTRPFQRVHIDFCEKDGNYFLVLIDSHSKWIEVKHMTSTTAERTVDELRLIFADHGLPEEIVSDNGPQLTSMEFEDFLKRNGVKHTLVPPYHPASNGAAERSVKTLKDALVKQVLEGVKGISMKHRLANFLLRYRTTPHSVTGRTPAELMIGRQLRTRISLVKPDLAKHVQDVQSQQKHYFDRHKQERLFACQDKVYVRSTKRGLKQTPEHWLPGTITKVCGPRSYLVRTRYSTRYVHVDHLKSRHDSEDMLPESQDIDDLPFIEASTGTSTVEEGSPASDDTDDERPPVQTTPAYTSEVGEPAAQATTPLRRSTRVRRPVQRLDL